MLGCGLGGVGGVVDLTRSTLYLPSSLLFFFFPFVFDSCGCNILNIKKIAHCKLQLFFFTFFLD